jgi:hypothetical protein
MANTSPRHPGLVPFNRCPQKCIRPPDIPSATAILDRFLHHAEIITMNGRTAKTLQ